TVPMGCLMARAIGCFVLLVFSSLTPELVTAQPQKPKPFGWEGTHVAGVSKDGKTITVSLGGKEVTAYLSSENKIVIPGQIGVTRETLHKHLHKDDKIDAEGLLDGDNHMCLKLTKRK